MPAKDITAEAAPFVTLYSYKGGVGRSMTVLNVSALLASRGFLVLIVDFDLEAPGLSHLRDHDVEGAEKNETGKKKSTARQAGSGVVELLSAAKELGPKADLLARSFEEIHARYTFSYPIPPKLKRHKGSSLAIMLAGRTDESYSSRLAALDLAGLYKEGLGKPLIQHFKRALGESGLYDYIVFDSRTGHSDEAGICTRDLADHLMIVTGFNRQNISGTASFLTNLSYPLSRSARKTCSRNVREELRKNSKRHGAGRSSWISSFPIIPVRFSIGFGKRFRRATVAKRLPPSYASSSSAVRSFP